LATLQGSASDRGLRARNHLSVAEIGGGMSGVLKVRDALKPGESAVAIFTRGGHFVLREDGTGFTGNWMIRGDQKLDKVVIYKRGTKGNDHEVYAGVPIKIVESDEAGRRRIHMEDIRFIGTTTLNWNEFTETKRGAANPIKYVKEPELTRLASG
jgi:hypothetical protein